VDSNSGLRLGRRLEAELLTEEVRDFFGHVFFTLRLRERFGRGVDALSDRDDLRERRKKKVDDCHRYYVTPLLIIRYFLLAGSPNTYALPRKVDDMMTEDWASMQAIKRNL
jgi:hypothetical protein